MSASTLVAVPAQAAERSPAVEVASAVAPVEVEPEISTEDFTVSDGGASAARTADPTGAAEEPGDLVAAADIGGFATVGVTWGGQPEPAGAVVSVRTRDGSGTWTPWTALEIEPGPEGARSGTAPYVAGDATHVEARMRGAAPGSVSELELVVIDPGAIPADASHAVPTTVFSPNGRSASGAVPALTTPASVSTGGAVVAGYPGTTNQPAMFSRGQWGADESLRRWAPSQGDFRGAVIHHTAGTNDYGADDVPAILRGIYAYHAVSRDWGDIGYNYLVDKFGRIWEGRSGGFEMETTGAHVSGFNSATVGVSVIGNYQTATVSNAAVDAVVRLLGWKLAIHGVDAGGRVTLNGMNLPTIFGHRDVASTTCPGQSLWVRQDEIRSRVKAEQSRYAGLWGKAAGNFVMSPFRPEIYLVVGSTKHHVSTFGMLTSLSNYGRVSDAADSYLGHLKTGKPLGRFVRDPRSGTVAYVDGNVRYRAATCADVAHFGSSCAGAVDVNPAQFAALAAGPTLARAVKSSSSERVYHIENGRKRWVTSWARLVQLSGGRAPVITVLSSTALNEFPTGANL